MHVMADTEKGFDQAFMTRTTDLPREALDVMVARLRARKVLQWKGKKITREAYINALWLWAMDQDPAHVEQILEPHVKRLEQAVGHPGPPQFGQGPPVKPKPNDSPSPRKRRGG